MAFNPMDFFEAGGKLGKSSKSPFAYGAENVMDQFKSDRQLQSKVAAEGGLENYKQQLQTKYEPERKQKELEAEYGFKRQLSSDMLSKLGISGGTTSGGNSGYIVDSIDPLTGDFKLKNVGAEQQVKRNESIQKGAGPEAGKIALAQESIKNIQDMRKILFPSGTPESFDRNAAMKSNMPLIGGAMPFDEQGQTLQRKGGASLAARQLIQTGVAARPEETKNLYKQFMANAFSNPKAAHAALDELEKFYNSYLGTTDPTNMFHGQARADVATDASSTAADPSDPAGIFS